MQRSGRVCGTILEAVGGTPLVRLNRIGRETGVRIAVKLETVNPGGSIKDRIALALVEAAEREGRLGEGGTIVEATAGNTGIALAMAAAVKGYRACFVVPDKMSPDKVAILRAYGAEVRIVPDRPRDDPDNYQRVAEDWARSIPGGCYMGQFESRANPDAHFATTGPEIWEGTGGRIAAVVAGVGTGGTISGIGRYLKERDASILVIGADPVGSIFTGPVAPFKIEGMGEDYYPTTFDPSVVDRWVAVSDDEAFAMARRLAREEGILAGGSTGAMVAAAVRAATEVRPQAEDRWIVAVAPDTGRNYLSGFFQD